MKKLLIIALLSVAAYQWTMGESNSVNIIDHSTLNETGSTKNAIEQAYKDHQSDVQVQGSGIVIKLLNDDNEGSRHQKFILRLASGQTLLIAHNIDLAPKINSLAKGDRIDFYGEYEWNNKGGVVHWTHHDPRGNHIGGWLKHKGSIYQ